MSRTTRLALPLSLSIALLATIATAQEGRRGRGFGRFFVLPKVTLAQLEEVQQELKLSEEQNEQVAELNDELRDGMRAAFEDAGGDREKMREGIGKIQTEVNAKFDKLLDEAQQKRAHEIFVQVNGSGALQDESIAAELKLTDEQKEELEEAAGESRQAFMDAGLRDLDDEARAEKIEELNKSRDEKAFAVLTEEQRAAFDKLKGAEIEVDLSRLPGFGRRGGGQGRQDST
jgi:Spy/CpxP family protein refolding chaperone